MTTTPLAEPLTVRAFLLGREGPDAGEALVDPLHCGGTARALLGQVRPLTAAADQAVERQLAGAVDSFLGQDLFDVAAGGWRKHAALTAAARRTRETPGSEEVLSLANGVVWKPKKATGRSSRSRAIRSRPAIVPTSTCSWTAPRSARWTWSSRWSSGSPG